MLADAASAVALGTTSTTTTTTATDTARHLHHWRVYTSRADYETPGTLIAMVIAAIATVIWIVFMCSESETTRQKAAAMLTPHKSSGANPTSSESWSDYDDDAVEISDDTSDDDDDNDVSPLTKPCACRNKPNRYNDEGDVVPNVYCEECSKEFEYYVRPLMATTLKSAIFTPLSAPPSE
jgi:hypothetical protein